MIISTKSLFKIISNSYYYYIIIIIIIIIIINIIIIIIILFRSVFFLVYMRLNLKIFDDLQKRYAKWHNVKL